MTSRDGTDVDARLRAALVPAEELLGRDGVDMSPEAITQRIVDLAEMSSLCLALASAAPGRAR